MDIEVMRKELREVIENGDDELIEKIYDIVKHDNWTEFTDKDIKELDERRIKRLSGESKA